MGGQSAVRAGKAFIDITTRNAALIKGLRSAQRRLMRFGAGVRNIGLRVAAVGGAILAPLALSAKYFASAGDRMEKLSRRTGLSVEALSELGFAADRSGTSMDALEKGLRRMQRNVYDLGRGLSTTVDAFDDIGLTLEDLAGLKPEDQFTLIADRLSQVEDMSRRAAIAQQLFGRSGTEMLPMIEDGAAGMEELRKQGRALGLTMSTSDAKAAAKFTDALGDLWSGLKMVAFQIGAALGPLLTDLSGRISRIAADVIGWTKRNRELVVTALKVGAIVAAVGAALIAAGTAISLFGMVLGGIASGISAVVAIIGALLSPIALVIVALAGLGAYFLYASGIGKKVLDWLGKKFETFSAEARAAIGAIGAALAAGDIKAAAKVLWTTLKLWWIKGKEWLLEPIREVKFGIVRMLTEAWYNVRSRLVKVWAGLQSAWVNVSSFFVKTWKQACAGIKSVWSISQTWLSKRMIELQGTFDKTLDVQAVKKSLDQRLKGELGKIGLELEGQEQKIEADRKRRLAEVQAERGASLADIEAKRAAAQKRQEQKFADRIRGAENEVKAARKAWEDALLEARVRSLKAVEPDLQTGAPPGALGKLGLAGLATAAAGATTRGGFSASVIRTLAGRGREVLAERTAKATEDTAKHTKDLAGKKRLAFT